MASPVTYMIQPVYIECKKELTEKYGKQSVSTFSDPVNCGLASKLSLLNFEISSVLKRKEKIYI